MLRRDDVAPFYLKHLAVSEKNSNFAAVMKKTFIILIVALGCLGCGSDDYGPKFGTEEECHYDEMQLKGQWEQIISEAAATPVQSLACHKVVRLAQYKLRQAGSEAVMECLANTKETLTSETAAMMMSDVYIQLGFANLAQRAAFEAMVTTKSGKLKTRALQRLTETAIITRQYELAWKYITILEEDGVNRQWLETIKPMVVHPETVQENPTFKSLQEQYEKTGDQFFM